MWLVCKEGATGGLLTREGPVSVKQQGGGGVWTPQHTGGRVDVEGSGYS